MRREIDEIPQAVQRLFDRSRGEIEAAGAALRDRDPAFLVTIARGSSDHAAHFIKYATELTAGVPVASLGPSLASIYGARLKLQAGAALAVSQSGKSPDIVTMLESCRRGGAIGIALVNTTGSPLALAAHHAIDISAGPEIAVAATKSFVNSIVAGLALLASWTRDEALAQALSMLPRHLEDVLALDWTSLVRELEEVPSLYMLGRGPSLAIASEAALKLKETANLHAEAFSSAEVLHGPVALVDRAFPVIAFAARDAAEDSVAAMADGLIEKGARMFTSSAKSNRANLLPFVETGHPLTDSLCLIVPFYGLAEANSRALGYNPDRPEKLSKVTETR
jgi:glucosamine--fructose-6-phosphate aminotransferase (isomerizing)